MRKKIIRSLIIIISSGLLIWLYFVITSTTKINYQPLPYEGGLYAHTGTNSYGAMLENTEITRPLLSEDIIIEGNDYHTFSDSEFHHEVKHVMYEGINGLLVPETGSIEYSVNVPSAGFYNLKILYYTVEGRSSSIQRGIKINDVYQFQEATNITLSRTWIDNFRVSEKRVDGKHDQKPSSIEKQIWNEEVIRDIKGYYDEPFLFHFESGLNTITLENGSEPIVIGRISICQEQNLLNYKEYLAYYENQHYQKEATGQIVYKVQAEDTYEHNQATLTPVASYTSYKVEPYAKFLTRYNTIGGPNWSISGDWISWQIEVPKAGLYQITTKFLQSYSRGLEANRILYINGEIPFKECQQLTFHYGGDWQNNTFGNNGEPFYFYLNEGINEIKLQNSIGRYATAVRIGEEVIAELNWVYRKVIMRTGVNPAEYQDYQLYSSIEGLRETIELCIKKIDFAINEMLVIAGERSNLISALDTTKSQLESFLKSERMIQKGIQRLESNITALGTWIMSLSSQPLSIDYIMIHGDQAKLPKPSINFIQRLGHEFIMLIGSYGKDTTLKSSVETSGETITVWIMTGRDQANLIRSMIDQNFTIQKNINVELKLVSSAVLLKAVLSGNGPDVAIGVPQNIPVNWGVRGAVVDLSTLPGFNEFSTSFYDASLTPFTYQESVYALPDTHDFEIQFVRTDIFQELGLIDASGKVIVPKSWNEVLDLLPILQSQYLDYYLPNSRGTLSPLLYAMINQYGGNLYINNGSESGLLEPESAQAFYDFVDFFRNYGFAVDASFTNRFRTGEMPIGVANFTLYNTLSVSAPEIRGNWEFSLLPGYDDGINIKQATTSTSSGTIITSQTKKLMASWEYVQWWLGEEAQTAYAKGMESILGSAARYPTANKKAFANLPWSAKDYYLLEEQRQYAVGIPTIPGDYIVGRYIDNAFRNILNEKTNPSDALYKYHLKINAELKRKHKELGLR